MSCRGGGIGKSESGVFNQKGSRDQGIGLSRLVIGND
ncbi:hypothetical protein LCGC14_1705310 [marine sediment metagenome]|uniref:Uncharacterized protein n=1 Tax=marine sediment metagenome TaxID=412755 RepID=A0A0F9I4G4_9ZZZZ